MSCTNQLAYCVAEKAQLPKEILAVVRYTCYGPDRKIVAVEQVDYHNTKQQREDFEDQVIASLACDIDVAILSERNVTEFPGIYKHIDY